MKVKVEVPAANGRKAYSYFREGEAGSSQAKALVSKKAAAGLGAIAVGGLLAGGLAIAGKKEEKNKDGGRRTAEENPNMLSELNEISGSTSSPPDWEAIASGMKGKDPQSLLNAQLLSGASLTRGYSEAKGAEGDEADRSPDMSPARERDSKFNARSATTEEAKIAEAFLARNSKSSIAPSESGKNSGNAIAEPKKSLLTQVAGSAGAAVGKLVRKVKEGGERDRVAREKLSSRSVDLDEAARKAGAGARSTLAAADNFARSFIQTFVDNKNTVNVKASEVKPIQKAIPSRTRRANRTLSSRRYNSLDYRIDSFIQSLRVTP